MSLPIKIKDEPLDPGYGDEIPKPFVVKSEADDDNIDEDIGNLLDMVPLFDDDINERNETSIRIKTEPVDSPPPASVSTIKKEPEDLPDDFFDCLNDQNFLEAIADEDDDDDNDAQNKTDGNEMKVNTSEIETELEDKTSKRSDDEDDESNDEKNEISREAVLTKEIEKLKRKIQKRTHKLGLKTETLLSKESLKTNDECSQSSSSSQKLEKQDDKYRRGRDYNRSRSGSRSPNSRKGRYRKRMRSRSRSRSRTRSRSRSRSTSYSRSRKNRRSRSRSPNNKKSKRPSFLEEIAETFARKGIPFPEKEKLEKMNKNVSQDQVKSSELNALKSSSSELNAMKSSSSELNAIKSLSPSSSNAHHKLMNSYNENKQMNDDGNEEEEFPLPIKIKIEPVDNDDNDTTNIYTNSKENNGEQTEEENIPAPMIIKSEPMDYDEDYNSEKATEEETPFARRLRVLNSCSEAIKNLHNRDLKKSNYKFLHTPIVFKSSNDDEHFNENRSVLNCAKNVMFSFNSTTSNINLKMYGLEKLSENASKVAEIIGFDVKSIKERLNQKDLPYSLKVLRKKSKNDASNNEQNDEDKKTNRYRPFYSNMATQTEPYSCSACIIRQLRKYKDTGVQVQPIAENHCSSQAHSQTGSPVQQQQQQQPYYMTGGNHQQQQQMSPAQSAPMMYNNYGQPMANSYPSYPYQQMTGYGPQPMMNMNGNMMPMQNMPVYPQQQQQPAMGMMPQPVPPPSQHQQHYPPNIRSHPGPRTLPSSSSNTRRNNYTIPTISPPNKR